jgi:sugar/nucleoside kinase (ribokinase family)
VPEQQASDVHQSGASEGFDVLLPGPYFCDLIFSGLEELPMGGREIFSRAFDLLPGACFHPVNALTRLGLRVGWACDFGTDEVSRLILDEVRHRGIDDTLIRVVDQPLCNVSASLSLAADRAFVTYLDEPPPRSYASLIERCRPRCLMLPGLYLAHRSWWLREQHGDPDLVQAARDIGATVFMDCQHVEVTLADPGVRDVIASVDVFCPNAGEALHLTGADVLEDAVRELAALAPLVVVKLGADGALAARGDERISSAAITVEAVDTTGAGDCFDAGFIYGSLEGEPVEQCLQYANLAGGLAVSAAGSEAAPIASELHELLAGSETR